MINIYDDTEYENSLRDISGLESLMHIRGTDQGDFHRGEKPIEQKFFFHLDPYGIKVQAEKALADGVDIHMLNFEGNVNKSSKRFNLFYDHENEARDRMEMLFRIYKEVNPVSRIGIYLPAAAEKLYLKGDWSGPEYLAWHIRQRQWSKHCDILFPSAYRSTKRDVNEIIMHIQLQKNFARWVHFKPVIHYAMHRFQDTLDPMPAEDFARILTACGDVAIWDQSKFRNKDIDEELIYTLQSVLN